MNAHLEEPRPCDGHEHEQSASSHPPQPVGGIEWERAGGPPLSFGQRLSLIGGAGAVVLMDLGPRLLWMLRRWGMPVAGTLPEKIDLKAWVPPDTRAARDAEQYLQEISSGPMINHSLRTYYFSGIMYELSGLTQSIDKEALYVAAALHDVGLFQTSPPANEHCFSVGSAREARRIATTQDGTRRDRTVSPRRSPRTSTPLFRLTSSGPWRIS
jgi:HD domain